MEASVFNVMNTGNAGNTASHCLGVGVFSPHVQLHHAELTHSVR